MYEYFKKNALDIEFYNNYIKNRLPDKIFDAHTHVNLPEHVVDITQEAIKGDWALECGLIMTYEDAKFYFKTFFPDKEIQNLMLPWPLKDADTKGNNMYISDLIKRENKHGLMTIRPEWDVEYIEKEFLKGRYCGFKPYPYFASAVKGADVSIYDFMPKEHFQMADKLKASVLMHLPRKGRLADDDNIKEICDIIQNYPNIKLVLAHMGRCFNLSYFKDGLKKLGDNAKSLYFDTAAVMNPGVLEYGFGKLDDNQIIYGTDLPIFLWHGKRRWSDDQYFNLCREDFSWNTHDYPEDEKQYTFFIYYQLKNILDIIDKIKDRCFTEKLFFKNAMSVYKKK